MVEKDLEGIFIREKASNDLFLWTKQPNGVQII